MQGRNCKKKSLWHSSQDGELLKVIKKNFLRQTEEYYGKVAEKNFVKMTSHRYDA